MTRPDLDSPEDFLRWVERAEPDHLVEGLLGLADVDRRRLAKPVSAAWRKAHPNRWTKHEWHLDLALLAVCSWTDVQRFRLGEARWVWQWKQGMMGGVFAILDGRRPEWLERWVERELESNDRATDWRLIRQLVRSGACSMPTGDGYIIQMIRSRGGAGNIGENLTDTLRRDPGILEREIWRIFEIDPANQRLFQYDEAAWAKEHHPVSWGQALVELAATSEIDRGQLLARSLATLRSGLQIRDSSFYVRLQERLKPTPEELEGLADALLDLVSHQVDVVARHAVNELARLIKAGRISPERIVERVPAALLRDSKSLAMAAMRLLRLAVKTAPRLGRGAVEATLGCLTHPNPEVQGAVLEFAEEIVPGEDAGLGLQLARQMERLAPSQRERALELHRRLVPNAPPDEGCPELQPARPDACNLVTAARSLPSHVQIIVDIEPIIKAIDSGEPPPTIDPDAAGIPRLDMDQRVAPLSSLDATIDCLASIFEGAEDPLEPERALDGLSRFADQRPRDLRERTGALLQRAKQPTDGMGIASAAALALGGLVARWLEGNAPKQVSWRRSDGPDFDGFFQARMDEVWDRLRARIPAEVLALPTHHGGWIDPRELVERLRRGQEAGRTVPPCDLIQALLRLAPDHRQEALLAASGIAGEPGQALRFALGGSGGPSSETYPTLWERVRAVVAPTGPREIHWGAWIAAARGRSPFARVPEFVGTPVESEPWATNPASFAWSVQVRKPRWSATLEPVFRVAIEPTGAKQGPEDHPLKLLAQRPMVFSTADVRLGALVWPVNPEPLLVAGCHAICERLFRPSSTWSPTAAYLEPLLDPAIRLTELANVALGLGLVAQDADARQMAIEVVASAMRDGRCGGRTLGVTIGRLAQTDGVVKLGRVGKAVTNIALQGPAQRLACVVLLEEVLASFQAIPQDALQLLVPYHELLIDTGQTPHARIVSLMKCVKGSSKTAAITREILNLQAQSGRISTARRDACAEMLRSRLDLGRLVASRLAS
jgi:hypothetical protein